MEDGEEKRAAFFRETGLDRKERFRQNASIPSRHGRFPWKLISVFLLMVFVVWSFMHEPIERNDHGSGDVARRKKTEQAQ